MMTHLRKKLVPLLLLSLILPIVSACNETNRDTSPVELIASATILRSTYDLKTPPTGDEAALANILLRALIKRATNPSDPALLDIKLRSYRVSYVRTDRGRAVPAGYTISINQLIPSSATAVELDNFVPLDPLATRLSPFAALLPQNGGVDRETGLRSVSLDIIVEIFGETLSGQDVYASTRFPMEFCYDCGG